MIVADEVMFPLNVPLLKIASVADILPSISTVNLKLLVVPALMPDVGSILITLIPDSELSDALCRISNLGLIGSSSIVGNATEVLLKAFSLIDHPPIDPLFAFTVPSNEALPSDAIEKLVEDIPEVPIVTGPNTPVDPVRVPLIASVGVAAP